MPTQILIADDNASVRAAMRSVLESVNEDWFVVEAEDGQQAVAKARELKPDLVILDLVMPAPDGLAASQEISRLMPNVPILMHTLYSCLEVELQAASSGVRRVLPKSDSSVLIAAVQQLLDPVPPTSLAAPLEPASADTVPLSRRREDKIRELTQQLFALEGTKVESPLVAELRHTLHQHIEQLRTRVAEYPVVERRVRTHTFRPEQGAPSSICEASAPTSNPFTTATVAEPPANSAAKPSPEGSH